MGRFEPHSLPMLGGVSTNSLVRLDSDTIREDPLQPPGGSTGAALFAPRGTNSTASDACAGDYDLSAARQHHPEGPVGQLALTFHRICRGVVAAIGEQPAARSATWRERRRAGAAETHF